MHTIRQHFVNSPTKTTIPRATIIYAIFHGLCHNMPLAFIESFSFSKWKIEHSLLLSNTNYNNCVLKGEWNCPQKQLHQATQQYIYIYNHIAISNWTKSLSLLGIHPNYILDGRNNWIGFHYFHHHYFNLFLYQTK